MPNMIKLLRDRRGVAAIEYALIASLISIAALAGYQAVGDKVLSTYTRIDDALGGAVCGTAATDCGQ
jgi:Flp pilus assembly pilin Flp